MCNVLQKSQGDGGVIGSRLVMRDPVLDDQFEPGFLQQQEGVRTWKEWLQPVQT